MDRDRIEGELKEQEGKLTDDEVREKQGQAQEKKGEAEDKLDDLKDEVEERFQRYSLDNTRERRRRRLSGGVRVSRSGDDAVGGQECDEREFGDSSH